jgi:CheY-like chemotaxis protein
MSHVLFLEPDKVLAKTYCQAVSSYGHTSESCPTAQQALNCADKTRPDVVIIELQLVAHSGIEFLYEFRSYADWQDIPVVILSNVPPAEFSESWILLRERLKVYAYHYKPQTDIRALIRVVNEATTPKLLV